MNLFQNNYKNVEPLAYKLRPKNLDDFVGQEKLLGKDGVIRRLILNSALSNSIFYGPPGCGKSSLGEIISNTLDCNFEKLNATTASVSDIRTVVETAKRNIFEFKALTNEDISKLIDKGLNFLNISMTDKIKEIIIDIAQGDSRIALNYVEMYNNIYSQMTEDEIFSIFKERQVSFDKKQDKYDMISAFIKSVRGSDPDAAVYWLARLLDGGEDPKYIARRLFIEASEDIGMANPEALLIANATMNACERIGMPEVRIILSHATVYLAISSKSNSVYEAINTALTDIKNGELQEVPINICHDNVGYKYPHSYSDNFVKQKYMNKKKKYYKPGNNKNEKMIAEKLNKLWNE